MSPAKSGLGSFTSSHPSANPFSLTSAVLIPVTMASVSVLLMRHLPNSVRLPYSLLKWT